MSVVDAEIADIQDVVRRGREARFSDEYNCRLRRLFPWPGRVETHRTMANMGMIHVVLEPGAATDSHRHDEEEAFFVLSGTALFRLGEQGTTVHPGDTIYVPRNADHTIENIGTSDFCFIDVYWDTR